MTYSFGLMVFLNGLALAGIFACNRMWNAFTERLIDDYAKRNREFMERLHKEDLARIQRWTELHEKMNDAWEDRVRQAFGMPPKPRGQLVELQADTSQKPKHPEDS